MKAEPRQRRNPPSPVTVPIYHAADAYLELLRDRGVKYFFGNGGTDFAPLIESFARAASEGKETPRPILVPHEFPAVSMAHGYALVTGEPQVVMVHVNVGTSNALTGIINASRAQVPLLFTAGRTPITDAGELKGTRNLHIHWAQESFDQASMLREYVKWDYELRNFAQLEKVVDRALEIAVTEPRGPVYLSLPREVLAEEHGEFTYTPSQPRPSAKPGPDPEAVRLAAEMLKQAEAPLVITSLLGRNPAAVGELVRFCESFAIPVAISATHLYMNFPTEHPLHMGFDTSQWVSRADVILVVESDVPWFPVKTGPRPDARIIHLGVDPLFSRYAMRTFPTHLALICDAASGLKAMREALQPYRTEARGRIRKRLQQAAVEHERWKTAAQARVEQVKGNRPIEMEWVSHCVSRLGEAETVLVNEYDLSPAHVPLKEPGSFYGSPMSSGLGWCFGAALGIKLARPESVPIVCMGDGTYHFSGATACHFVAQNVPVVVVVFNNQCWNAVKRSTLDLYPQGTAARESRFALCDLEPAPAYEKIVEAFGGYGERVEDPGEVLPALKRAVRAVWKEKRQALLNVVCRHP